MRKLYLAFIWHMHQPMYRAPRSHDYMMPWVRLHAVKDYLDMVDILSHYPRLKQTFNLVPSLLEQIQDYADGKARDRYLDLSEMPVSDLSVSDKEDILNTFFDLNWEQMIRPFARYQELADQRSAAFQRFYNYRDATQAFSDQDFLDLTTWFNLAWIDPQLREYYPELKALLLQGRDFTAAQRQSVLDYHQVIIKRILPTYHQMVNCGQIELTTTPYYHPILPLLADSANGRRSRPESALPEQCLAAPEDARYHLKKGLDYFEKQFGYRANGLWPSEQSLSPDVLPLIANEGIQWLASSEGILWHSLQTWSHRNSQHIHEHAECLYRPYRLPNGLQMVFRDIYLSDLIGFQCWKGDNEHNAHLFYQQIKQTQAHLEDKPDFPYLMTIALDGENCWEYYHNDGHHFLNVLYKLLSEDPDIESVTVSDYLERFPAQTALERLHPGSWIRSDFSTWIGDPTKNLAWDLLISTREALLAHQDQLSEPDKAQAWEMIYIAEGSDWFWWFGEGNSSAHDHLFDQAFRTYLQTVYEILAQPVPTGLLEPLENQIHTRPPRLNNSESLGTMQASQEGY